MILHDVTNTVIILHNFGSDGADICSAAGVGLCISLMLFVSAQSLVLLSDWQSVVAVIHGFGTGV